MEVCRLCNVSNPRGLFYQIFDNPQTNPTIPEIVEMLADVKIVEDDPYTKMICFNCYNVLITIHKYRERILETNRSLKQSFHENSALICCNEKNEQFEVDLDNSDADSDCEMNLRLGSDSEDEDNHYSSTSNDEDYNKKLHENNVVGSDEEENHQIDNNHEFANKSIDCAPSEIKIVDANDCVEDNSNKVVSNGQNLKNDYYECDICGKKYTLKAHFIRHFKIHTDGELYKCHFCNRKFTQKTNPTDHLKLYTGGKPHTCNICGKRFTLKSNLNVHLKIHTGEKRYTCNFCDKRFIQKSNLNRHLKIHTVVRSEKDENQRIDDTHQFPNKSVDYAPNEIKIVDANNCVEDNSDKIVLNEQNLKNDYECDICGKKCTLKAHLIQHIKLHRDKELYKCHFCNRKFTQKTNLTDHLKLHTGENPYTCNICGKRFTQKSNLKVHLRIHTGEKLYTCNICDKRFTRSGTLHNHMRIHTGEKSYKCDICHKTFSHISNLSQHLKTHTSEKPFT